MTFIIPVVTNITKTVTTKLDPKTALIISASAIGAAIAYRIYTSKKVKVKASYRGAAFEVEFEN